jgi:hypothetical protein
MDSMNCGAIRENLGDLCNSGSISIKDKNLCSPVIDTTKQMIIVADPGINEHSFYRLLACP